MVIRMLGAALTLFSGALYAINITKEHREKEGYLEELQLILEHFAWELQTNLSPLSICCLAAGRCGKGKMAAIFTQLSQALDAGGDPSATDCLDRVVKDYSLPISITSRLEQLADTLGRYDLAGQIAGIHAIGDLCQRDLQALQAERRKTVKSCQTLGLCTGAAVAILLF